jgi:hypothetical protein
MKYTIDFGKVDYNNSGRKNCRVTVEVSLEDGRLSICGSIWNPRETDIYSGGQNIDEIAKLLRGNARIQRIKAVWERWHLNDLRAGTPAQMAYLREHPVNAVYPESHYKKASKVLTDAGLNPDGGYKYGFAWLKEELPADVVAMVENQFQVAKAKTV